MTLRPYVEPGLRQLRRLWLPFVMIQLVGLAIVLSYFFVPSVAHAFDVLARVKAGGGLAFSAVALAFACGVLPEIFKAVTGVDRTFDRDRLTFTLHNVVLFGLIGITSDLFYRFLGNTFGDSRAVSIVLTKTAIDQFLYSAGYSVPLICWTFTLRKYDYAIRPALRELGVSWYLTDALLGLIVNWAYWWPMGLLMYTLPPTLTFVYGAIASAASATLITAIASEKADGDAARERERETLEKDLAVGR